MNRCEATVRGGYDFHFLDDSEFRAPLRAPLGHPGVCFGTVEIRILGQFFNRIVFLLLSYVSYLYILITNSLSDT